MKKNFLGSEDGFWSIIFLLLLTTLASIGMSTYNKVKLSGSNAVNQMNMVRADYAATSVIYYGIQQALNGIADTTETVTIDNASMQLDNTTISRDTLEVQVTSDVAGAERVIRVRMVVPTRIEENAVTTEGTIFDGVHGADSTGTEDPSLLVDNATLPPIDDDSLKALAAGQGNTNSPSGLTIGFGNVYPVGATSFWKDSLNGIPHYTYVYGNLDLKGTLYGICIVEGGDVYLYNNSRVVGVLYVMDRERTVIRGTDDAMLASVIGGVISYGDVESASQNANNRVFVRHIPRYLNVFVQHITGGVASNLRTVSWEYL